MNWHEFTHDKHDFLKKWHDKHEIIKKMAWFGMKMPWKHEILKNMAWCGMNFFLNSIYCVYLFALLFSARGLCSNCPLRSGVLAAAKIIQAVSTKYVDQSRKKTARTKSLQDNTEKKGILPTSWPHWLLTVEFPSERSTSFGVIKRGIRNRISRRWLMIPGQNSAE